MSQEIRFRVIVDDAGVPAAAARTSASLGSMGTAAERFGSTATISARQTAAAMRTLPAQMTDIATQLAGGQNPLLILLQQGGQIKDSFGGAGNAVRALAGAITPVGAATALAAAAVGVMGAAIFQADGQVAKLQKSLALTGGAAGVTAGQVLLMGDRLAQVTREPIGRARDAMQALAAGGEFVGHNMELAGRAALAMSRLTGQSVEDTVRRFSGMRDGVTQWSSQANHAYNFLTAAQLEHIKTLELQGRSQEAATFALTQFAEAAESRAVPAMGMLERAAKETGAWASKMWDKLLGVGRPETPETKLRGVAERIAEFQRELSQSDGSNPARDAQARGELSKLAQQQNYAREEALLSQRIAEGSARRVQDEREQEIRNSKAFSDTLLNLRYANSQLAAEQDLAAAEARKLLADDQYRKLLISAGTYEAALIEGERATVAKQLELAQQSLAISRARKIEPVKGKLPEQLQAEHAAEVAAKETQLVTAIRAKQQLEARVRAGEFAPAPRNIIEEPGVAFRLSELSGGAQVQRAIEERATSTRQALAGLVDENRNAGVQLIRDERVRGEAQIELDAQVMRRRIDLGSLSVAERVAAESQFATWRLQREAQLTEQLKPQWQRQAEAWADTTRYMRDRFDEFTTGFVDSGKTAFQQWAQDGRITSRGLAQYIKSQFAQMAYEQYLASYVRSAGQWLFNSLLGTPASATSAGGGVSGGGISAGGGIGGSLFPTAVGGAAPSMRASSVSASSVQPAQTDGGVTIVQNFSVASGEGAATLRALASMASDAAVSAVANLRQRGNPGFAG